MPLLMHQKIRCRMTNRNSTQSFLVFSKSRLCPVKGQSIPRLELSAALIGCRALNFVVRQAQQPTELHIWSDSLCVLHWIESVKPNPERFVENRLIETRKSSTVFHYVSSSHNPADIATRWILPHDLKNEQLYWTGPTWLAKEKVEWPQWSPSRRTEHHELETKILSIQDKEVNLGIQREVVEIKKYAIHELFDVNRYGSWYKYLHVIIYVLRFIKLTSSNKVGSTKQVSSSGVITPEESKIAEKIAFREVQNSVENKTEEKEKWQLCKDIPQGRSTVKKAIKDCMFCKRWLAKPFCLPLMPPCLTTRVNSIHTLQYVGLDYLNPINIRDGNAIQKRWICLFTCLSARAVHLKLSAEAFLHCLRRFVARRCVPKEIISDNASQFTFVQKTIESYCSKQRIKWKFITEHAP
ncbi:unnamed protein product [Gongylonema pulchrum]|uniref:Integrase catalytic domain-containing protein n=1 Tax=Gongylonema pulchrum TaxID=637853 RepID=A0A183D5F5_9BILA|nr:unnamed protein product [Gongylonema pulchrum]